MENIDICPYCGALMHLGFIYQDRFSLKWIPEEKDKGIFLQGFSKGIKLTSLLTDGSIKSYHCNECKKIIIDTKNMINQNS